MEFLNTYPSYLALARAGELKLRARKALEILTSCTLCPHRCGINRMEDSAGFCKMGRYAFVASYFPHTGEEDCIKGRRGSGTIFFSGCNLQCVFCQNWDISHYRSGEAADANRLAQIMMELQRLGCHNINLVTPTHVVPQILEALDVAVEMGLRLPIVYNTGGYDSVETLKLLDGVIDIYMPDFKVWDEEIAARLLNSPDYPEVARNAIKEMHRQVGDLIIDKEGIARRGLLVRHLVMPSNLAGTKQISGWLVKEISRDTYINLMNQYHPDGDVILSRSHSLYKELARLVTREEYQKAFEEAKKAGLHRFD
ncbi:MAG: radical SAM protein [Verrucomicrobiia bacterium]